MDAFPANSLEDPFLGPDHDQVTHGHRGSSPQRTLQALHLPIPDFSTPSGASGADDQPSSDTSGDMSRSFGETHAADTLVNLANWSFQPQFADYHELQTTICPEAVRPRTAPELGGHRSFFPDTPPPYASVSSSSSSSFAAPTPTHFDVPIHPDVFEAEPKYGLGQPMYDVAWPTPSEISALSDLPPSSIPQHHAHSWEIDPDFSPPRPRRAPSPTFSTTSSVTWANTLKSPSLGRLASQPAPAQLKFRGTPMASEDPLSPTVSMLEPTLDVKSHTSQFGPVDEEEVIMGMDSPAQVYHQLTDPLDEPEPTDVDTDGDDGEYVDKADEVDTSSVRVRGPQKQNHRKTFKVGLWDAINDPSFCHLIRWSADGDSGEIPDKSKFQGSKAMRAITDAKDFGGFVRQLHMWGFSRFSFAGDRSCGFRHENFRRGRLDLLEDMKRKGETKIMRPATRKLKPATRAKKNKAPPVAVSSDIKSKPKRAPRTRAPKSKVTVDDDENSESETYDPTDDLEPIASSTVTKARSTKPRYTSSTVAPRRMIHKQSAERDSPVPPPSKRSRVSKQSGVEAINSVFATPMPSQIAGPSKKTVPAAPTKRRAPAPDPISSPTKPPKVARTRS